MNGFKHIKLKNHKGLKVAKLFDLGKINVVCGPNNSGKTTTLECIESENKRDIGIIFDEEITGRINVASMQGRTWTIMDQHDLSVFQQSHKLIALVDKDPGSSAVRKRFLKKCEELNIPVTHLERYSLENYFSVPAIAAVMTNTLPASITVLDPKKKVSDQLGFDVKNMGGKIAKEMKLEDVDGTDFGVFLKQVEALIDKR